MSTTIVYKVEVCTFNLNFVYFLSVCIIGLFVWQMWLTVMSIKCLSIFLSPWNSHSTVAQL